MTDDSSFFASVVFQFHYGSVKSHWCKIHSQLRLHFNSTMVRLKVPCVNFNTQEAVLFQFHYGSVKSLGKSS